MLSLLMLAAVLVWTIASARRQTWQEALLRATVLSAAAAVLFTESVSLSHNLTRSAVVAGWIVFIGAGFFWFWQQVPVSKMTPASGRSWLNVLYGVAVGAIVAVVAFTALRSAPNSWDAMAYHLPRILYWVQARSVEFFPTSYFNQISLQPGAEYLMLQTYLLSGGDHFVNLVQAFAFGTSIVAVSALAGVLGLDGAGQVVAALVAGTLPSAILQASGAKNDTLLGLWLVCALYFAARWARDRANASLLFVGISVGLALFTKATAYLFLPPLLAGVFVAATSKSSWKRWASLGGASLLGALLLNRPQYWRNFELSGSVLGYDSAHGDGLFRWRNESLGWKPTISNLLRNVSDQLGARSERWNQGVYQTVNGVHALLGIDPQDPSATWRWSTYGPPKNTNHEADANNRWQFMLILLGIGFALFQFRRHQSARWLLYGASLVLSFLAFCFYLKWQPFSARLFLPLFVAGCPLAAFAIRSMRSRLVEALISLLLVSNARLALFQNWTRPLQGEHSILHQPRDLQYFNDMTQWNNRDSYLQSVTLVAQSGCSRIGIDASINQLEYPFEALVLERAPDARFTHVGVTNRSERYRGANDIEPCLVWCPDCAGIQEKSATYEQQRAILISKFVVFLRPALR